MKGRYSRRRCLGFPSRLRLDILDLSGSPIRNVFDGSIEAGSYTLRWDGTAEDGGEAEGSYQWVVLPPGEGSRIYGLTMRATDD